MPKDVGKSRPPEQSEGSIKDSTSSGGRLRNTSKEREKYYAPFSPTPESPFSRGGFLVSALAKLAHCSLGEEYPGHRATR